MRWGLRVCRTSTIVPTSSKNASQCRYSLINRACEELFGVSRTQIIGKTIDEIYPKERADFIIVENDKTLQSHQAIALPDYEIHTLSNGVRLVTAKSIAVRDDDGNAELLLTVLDDVTERRRTEQRIAHMAHYDALTDLPNRVTFKDTLDATLKRVATTGEQFAVLSLDLDHFKEANDTYGHVVGDELLIEIARRLKVAAGATFLARLGGDEFVLVGVNGTQPAAAAALAERLLATLADDFEVEGHRLKLGMSIGIAIYPTDGADTKTLMTNADAALYRVKVETRGMAMFFEPEMSARLHERY
jgi:diguanylate cyclase (GGDEF)-like protein/PAS domain S-box-containing protein